jgi:plasmid stability protein
MSVTLNLPEELAKRLAAEASRRGVSVDELSAELLAAGLEGRRRRLAFAGVGASGSGRGAAQADEMLAEGFGEN